MQEVALRARPDIVVATPGRMLDHLQNSLSVGLEDLSILVLDEADRLLELGFTQEVHELVRIPVRSCFQNFCSYRCRDARSVPLLDVERSCSFDYSIVFFLSINLCNFVIHSSGTTMSEKKANYVIFCNNDR